MFLEFKLRVLIFFFYTKCDFFCFLLCFWSVIWPGHVFCFVIHPNSLHSVFEGSTWISVSLSLVQWICHMFVINSNYVVLYISAVISWYDEVKLPFQAAMWKPDNCHLHKRGGKAESVEISSVSKTLTPAHTTNHMLSLSPRETHSTEKLFVFQQCPLSWDFTPALRTRHNL